VMEKAEAIGGAETALQKERLRTMLAIRALLTPEQRRELVRIHEEFRAEHPKLEHGGWRRWRDHGGRE
jgi:Spy/CpxP family protein refolding chaperone